MQNEYIVRKSARFLRAFDKDIDIEAWFHENKVPGIAMVGRSNVGKSSIINKIFGDKTAKTSKTPGRTQKINIFQFKLEVEGVEQKFFLYDLPGYGFAKVSKAMITSWQGLMHSFFLHMNSKTLICNIQDARHPNQKSDLAFHEYINPDEVDIGLIFNKIDKLKKQSEKAQLKNLKKEMKKKFKNMKFVQLASAEKGTGCEELEILISEYLLGANEDS
jgi:GTP-binding protein